MNGDGYDDVLVGAGGYDDGHDDEGAAFLYLGGTGRNRQPADGSRRGALRVRPGESRAPAPASRAPAT